MVGSAGVSAGERPPTRRRMRQGMELRRYLALLWRWSWLLAAGAVVVAAAALLYARHQTPIFQAKATILVNQAQALTGLSYSDVLANQQLCKTYAQLVPSRPVLEAVSARTGIDAGRLGYIVDSTCRRDTQLIDV